MFAVAIAGLKPPSHAISACTACLLLLPAFDLTAWLPAAELLYILFNTCKRSDGKTFAPARCTATCVRTRGGMVLLFGGFMRVDALYPPPCMCSRCYVQYI